MEKDENFVNPSCFSLDRAKQVIELAEFDELHEYFILNTWITICTAGEVVAEFEGKKHKFPENCDMCQFLIATGLVHYI